MFAGTSRDLKVTLIYSDSSKEEIIPFSIRAITSSTTENYTQGSFYLNTFLAPANNPRALGQYGFTPLTVETDASKTLTAVKINDGTKSSTALCIHVISAWGEKAGSADFISAVEEMMADGIDDVDEYKAIKAYMLIS